MKKSAQPHCDKVPAVCTARSAHLCETTSNAHVRCAWDTDRQECHEAGSSYFLRHEGLAVNGWFAHGPDCVDPKFRQKETLALCQHDCNSRKACLGFEYGVGAKNSNLCVLRSCHNASHMVRTLDFDFYSKEEFKLSAKLVEGIKKALDAQMHSFSTMFKHDCLLKRRC